MRITVIGTGYVGLVTGTCFADSGNHVTGVDIDEEKIRSLNCGQVPIYEPGLAELVKRNLEAGRLDFTTEVASAVRNADIVYLAVGTPQSDDGSADLTAMWKVADAIADHLTPDATVVIKSTVPVGTNAKLTQRLQELTGRTCRVASNPEFLKEGSALEDFAKPDRVVVGVRQPEVADVLRLLYSPFLRTDNPFLVMSPESAELTKYVANAMLATKISFINQMANLCERCGGDINDVRRGIGHDRRIGFAFMFPGVGYGGSCFPKDVRAMVSTFEDADIEPRLLDAVDWVNQQQKLVLANKIEQHFRQRLPQTRIAIWGLAFKPRTDDIREAPSLILIDRLLQLGAKVCVHDPVAMDNVRAHYAERVDYSRDPIGMLRDADALAILTEWGEFRTPNFALMRQLMADPVVFDGRNLFDLEQMKNERFTYYSIGRPTVFADGSDSETIETTHGGSRRRLSGVVVPASDMSGTKATARLASKPHSSTSD